MGPGILRISETRRRTVEADRAFIHLVASSQKVVFGRMAHRAAESLQPIAILAQTLDPRTAIDTESIRVEAGASPLSKTSRATYSVRITTTALDRLGDLLARCAENRDIVVDRVTWGYDDEAACLELSRDAAGAARRKGEAMAAALGYRVTGIHACRDIVGPMHEFEAAGTQAVEPSTLRRRDAVVIGTEFRSSKEIAASCSIEFYIEPAA